jgi:hypothetical protein
LATPKVVVLGTGSFLLSARVVVLCTDSEVVHVTLVRYEHALGRVAWALAAPIHRRIAPYLLRRAGAQTGMVGA